MLKGLCNDQNYDVFNNKEEILLSGYEIVNVSSYFIEMKEIEKHKTSSKRRINICMCLKIPMS